MLVEQHLSNRVRNISPSATISIDSKTKALLREGKPVINMSVGEPDFDTPVAASFAGMKAIADGQTRYTPAAGMMDLRKAIAKKLMEENGLQYSPEQIIVSSGAKHSLFNIFLTICDEGDEVIVPAPYWVSYPEQIRVAGGKPVIVDCDESTGFKITAEQLEGAMTERTRAVLLNSPSNPTGAVYTEQELRELGEVLSKTDVYIVTDEIYERLVYDVQHFSLPALYPNLLNRTLLVNGFSKAFAMTGWRLGYVAAPPALAKAMSSLQSHSTGNPATMSQFAGLAALDNFDESMILEFRRRRDRLVQGLRDLPGVTCLLPDGAFYAFPNVSQLFQRSFKGKRIENSTTFCELLLEHELVSAVPGDAFGAPQNLRLSYATSYENVETALERMAHFIQQLQ